MSNYEFWDELGKIFNAVVAYQEKTIEFNKRFINPWIRLGNVFDKQDRNEEAIGAYQKAIEIDPNNSQNWYEAGNIHFRMGKYDDAVDDYNHAIDLDPDFGSPYSNLALTLVTQGKYIDAIPLYRKSIELLEEDKDKAVAWNRLGNLYRKLNEYDMAVESFQNADELDQENAGFRDNLDDVPEAPTLVEADSDGDGPGIPVAVSISELIPSDDQTDATLTVNADDAAPVVDASTDIPTQPSQSEVATIDVVDDTQSEVAVVTDVPATDSQAVDVEVPSDQPAPEAVSDPADQPEPELPIVENVAEVVVAPSADVVAAQTNTESAASVEAVLDAPVEPAPDAIAQPASVVTSDETVTVVVQSTVETFTETVTLTDTSTETTDATLTVATTDEVIDDPTAVVTEVVVVNPENTDSQPTAVAESDDASAAVVTDVSPVDADGPDPVVAEAGTQATQADVVEPVVVEITSVEVVTETVDTVSDQVATIVTETVENPPSDQPAYEEYLKDSNDPIHIYQTEPADKKAEGENSPAPQEPVAKIDNTGELQIEMDTKNAHVWNELGNVYFNTGAFDDAVIAYSKAIELDRWFAWPYSNLALTYVQKGRFVEAILLYQRSIELFASDKDKAISWNRLGNVYRRINDYENAIASYQRADELDPDNTTLSLQSRFSLLGSYVMEQKPTYVS
jgi:tetratricopeptide (TPR) repeat protein